MKKLFIRKPAINKEELFEILKSSGIKLNKYAEIIFESKYYNYFHDAEEITIFDLDLTELGLLDGGSYAEVYETIESHPKFDFCPIEFAPFIRFRYNDLVPSYAKTNNQHPPDSIIILSKPLVKEDDFPKGFYLRNIDGEKYLRGYICSQDYFFDKETKVIIKKR